MPSPEFVTYAIVPKELIAMYLGNFPTKTDPVTLLVAMSIMLTELPFPFTASAVVPSGVMAMPKGEFIVGTPKSVTGVENMGKPEAGIVMAEREPFGGALEFVTIAVHDP